jgi:hypothetical protein
MVPTWIITVLALSLGAAGWIQAALAIVHQVRLLTGREETYIWQHWPIGLLCWGMAVTLCLLKEQRERSVPPTP